MDPSAGTELDEQLSRWVAAGAITDQQAGAIRDLEAQVDAAKVDAAHAATAEERPISLVAEVIGYVGLALAVGAAGLLVSQYWSEASHGTRLAFVGAATALGLVGGLGASRSDEQALLRLASVLWFGAALGTCIFTGLVFTDVHRLADENILTVAAAAGSVVALALDVRLRMVLQDVALFGCSVALVCGLVGHLGEMTSDPYATGSRIDLGTYGGALWGLGAVWLLLTWAGVLQRPAGYLLGSVLTFVAALLVRDASVRVSLWMGLLTAAALLAASVATRSRTLLVVGVLGTFAWVAQTIEHLLGRGEPGRSDNVGMALGLFAAGALLVGVAFAITRVRRHRPDEVTR